MRVPPDSARHVRRLGRRPSSPEAEWRLVIVRDTAGELSRVAEAPTGRGLDAARPTIAHVYPMRGMRRRNADEALVESFA